LKFERFADFPSVYREPLDYDAHMAKVKAHWASLGWQEVPCEEVEAIRDSWRAHLQPNEKLVIPRPSRTWRGEALARHRADPNLEVDFTLKMLSAFRRCTRVGERLWVIDWQHSWWYFDPHAGITVATRDEWAKPMLPEGDGYNYVAPDFRFGVVEGWRETGPVTLFGSELLLAFDADPPEQFLRVCGPGKRKRARARSPKARG
jgi:hypothetical protein